MTSYYFSLVVALGTCFTAEAGGWNEIEESVSHQVFSFQVVNADTEGRDQIIQEVLVLQNSLIVDNSTTTELPLQFEENGFLTIRMKPEGVLQVLLEGGKIITARCQDQLVGYLILSELGNYFSWLSRAHQVEIDLKLSVMELEQYYIDTQIKILEQIAVATAYAKQGIGKQLVNMAKQLAPHGLSTDILYRPFTNHASFAFFSKQGFVPICRVYVIGRPPKCILHEIWVELWQG